MINSCNNNRIILSVLILIGFSTIAGAIIPVTYSCCVNHTNNDGPQVENFENIPFGGTQLEDFEGVSLGGTLIDGFENISSWIGEVANPTADTINYKEGTQGLKLNVTNGNKYLADKTVYLDLSTTNNFGIWLYIPDATNFSYFRLYFTSNNNFTNYSSYFTYSSYDGFKTGWNKLIFDKSMFTNTNNESWNNTMNMMRVIIYATIGNNTSATVDDLRYNVDNDWMVGGVGVYQQADTVNFNEGHQGLELGATNGNRVSSDKPVNYDLSATNNLGIWLYVPDPSTLDFIRLYLTSAGADWTSYFTASAYGGFKAGWNKLVFDKSMFANTNNESWNNTINRIKIAIYPLPGNNTNVTVDDLRYGVNNDWLPEGSGYIQSDSANVKEGSQGLKLVGINDNRYPDGGTVYIDKVINTNFSDLNNFAVWVWVENGTNTNFVMMYLTSDSEWNRFLYSRQWSSVKRGWNKLVFSKNNFVNIGNESWNNVMGRMRIRTASINGSVGITFDDLRRDLTGDRARIMFQFDDGDLTVYTNAFPIMSRNNQTGVSFATTGFMEEPEQDPTDPFAMMIVPQLKELQSAGWDISSHTINHPDLSGVGNPAADIIPVHNESELISELNGSYAWLIANKFQKSAGFIAYPYGRFNDLVIDRVKERYVLGRSTNPQNALQYFAPEDDAVQYIQGTINVYNDTSVQWLKDSINDSINSKLLGLVLFHVIRNGTTIDPYDYLTSDFQIISDYVKSRSADVDMITYEDLVIPKINNFTPVINKTTRIYANGSSVLITDNMYDEYMPNMTIVPYNGSIDIGISLYNESYNEIINKSSIIFNESIPNSSENIPNSSIGVSYNIGDRKPNQGYKIMINWTNGTLIQTINVMSNGTGYISYNSYISQDFNISGSRYQTITPTNFSNYIPPIPINMSSKYDNFWINTTWLPGIGNKTEGYNVTVNGSWINSTYNYINSSLYPHAWQNVTVYGYNASGLGSISLGNISNNTQIPNNPVIQPPIGDKVIGIDQSLMFTINSTDLDNDNITYGANATKGYFNNSTGQFSWTPNSTDIGIYIWNFSSSDEYGSIASGITNITVITVNSTPLSIVSSIPTTDPTTTFGTSQTFEIGLNKTANVTWYINGSIVQTDPSVIISNYTNSTANIGIYNVTVIAEDGLDSVPRIWNWSVLPLVQARYNVSGYVFDNYGIGLDAVSVQNSSYSNNTDYSGHYLITGLLNGTYNFSYSKTGFDSGYLEVTIDGSDNNSANVSIYDNTPPPTPITVISPNGGENWARGTNHTIRWNYTGSPGSFVNITLMKGGVFNRTINSSVPIGSSDAGSYSWLINSTQTLGTDYRVRITSTTNSAYNDISDNNLTILAIPAGYGYIYGKVMNDSIGIAGALVITNTTVSTTTDTSGFYSLLLPAGKYNLTATKEPAYYENRSVVVTAISGTAVMKDIMITRKLTGTISGIVRRW